MTSELKSLYLSQRKRVLDNMNRNNKKIYELHLYYLTIINNNTEFKESPEWSSSWYSDWESYYESVFVDCCEVKFVNLINTLSLMFTILNRSVPREGSAQYLNMCSCFFKLQNKIDEIFNKDPLSYLDSFYPTKEFMEVCCLESLE